MKNDTGTTMQMHFDEGRLAIALLEYGLYDYWQAARRHLRHAIPLHPRPGLPVPAGGSKLGGLPDVPPDWRWPLDPKQRPMSLIAQIDLAAVKPFDVDDQLPETGMLYLFYELEEQVWGFDPADAGKFQIAWLDVDKATLRRRDPPPELDIRHVLRESALTFGRSVNLPEPESFLMREYKLSEHEKYAFIGFYDAFVIPPLHKLLGHSECVQDGMELECQKVSHGLYCGSPSDSGDGRHAELEAGAADWRLLMQIDIAEEAGDVIWGCNTHLYAWIRKQDLAARRFQHAWLIAQCT